MAHSYQRPVNLWSRIVALLAGKAALTHATQHKNGGSDEVATATAAANAIPKAGAGGTLDKGWIPSDATVSMMQTFLHMGA